MNGRIATNAVRCNHIGNGKTIASVRNSDYVNIPTRLKSLMRCPVRKIELTSWQL